MRESFQSNARVRMHRCLVVLAILVYCVSFFLPTFPVTGSSILYGYAVFYICMLGLFFPWLANPLIWLAMLFMAKRRRSVAVALSLLATALAASMLAMRNQGDVLLIGYYVWLSSTILFAIAAAFIATVTPRREGAL